MTAHFSFIQVACSIEISSSNDHALHLRYRLRLAQHPIIRVTENVENVRGIRLSLFRFA